MNWIEEFLLGLCLWMALVDLTLLFFILAHRVTKANLDFTKQEAETRRILVAEKRELLSAQTVLLIFEAAKAFEKKSQDHREAENRARCWRILNKYRRQDGLDSVKGSKPRIRKRVYPPKSRQRSKAS